MSNYDFGIAQVGDRISYTEDTTRSLEITGKIVHKVETEENFQVGIDPDGTVYDYYWVIPKGEQAFDYTVELEEWVDDE